MEPAIGSFPQHNSRDHLNIAELFEHHISPMLRVLRLRVVAMLRQLIFDICVTWVGWASCECRVILEYLEMKMLINAPQLLAAVKVFFRYRI